MTASWSSPTLNTSSIAGYRVTVLPTRSTVPTVFSVPASKPSVMLSNLAILTGSIQVVAYDAFGNLGMPSMWVIF
jgi:hypothetical protein